MKTELTTEDKQRIEQEAFKRYPDGEDIDLNWHYRTVFVSSAEYENKYQREQQAELGLRVLALVSERSELVEYNNNLEKTLRICLTVKPHTESVDAMKAMIKTLLENSLKK